MPADLDPVELVSCSPDERLLGDDLAQLPASLGHPEQLPPSRVRAQVVGLGATLTGVTLVLGVALVVFGIVEAVSGSAGIAVAAAVVGLVLIGTHWGWVHVAELTANRIEHRRLEAFESRRRQWLSDIAPYTRWEVRTRAGDDGSITIETVRHRPVRCGEATFTFVREVEAHEVHSGEEPAAEVTERAELLRRHAAVATTRARQRFEAAHDAYERALIADASEQERQAALHAASEALSEQLNTHLSDPPLVE